MGTRGLWGFIEGEKEYLTYNHFDSYPSGLGASLLTWLRKVDIAALREDVGKLTIVDEQKKPTKAQKKKLARFLENPNGYSDDQIDWYWLLRSCQGDPAATLSSGYIIEGAAFAEDSLFCEWAYVIDLDAGQFEVYRGFQTAAHDKGRFADRLKPEDTHSYGAAEPDKCYRCGVKKGDPQAAEVCPEGYYPIALLKAWPLDALPSSEELEQVENAVYAEAE